MSMPSRLARSSLLCALLIGGSGTAMARSVVTEWNDEALEAVRATRPGPPMVARMLAVTNTAMYDAWAAYSPRANGTQLSGELRRPAAERTEANRRKAVSYAAHRALIDLFPSRKTEFDAQMRALGYDPADATTSLSTPQGIGKLAAAAVIDYRHRDGSNQLGNLSPGAYSDYTGYRPVNTSTYVVNPARWQPLQVPDGLGGYTVQTHVAPHWGKVKGFALKDYHQFPVKAPPAYGSWAFVRQALEIVHHSASLDDRRKTMAEYWADGPASELPPGHWVLFARFVSDRDRHGTCDDVKMHFALTNAMLDASIAVWGLKRHYDYARPVTAIRYLFKDRRIPSWAGEGRGTRLIRGQDWRPYQAANFVTPPFSEYVSGHSAFSAAGAEVLRRYTGSDAFGGQVTVLKGSSRVEPGLVPSRNLTLAWRTFSDAANEAGISRQYGGIHFAQGDMESRLLGRKVGAQSYALAAAYVQGRAGN